VKDLIFILIQVFFFIVFIVFYFIFKKIGEKTLTVQVCPDTSIELSITAILVDDGLSFQLDAPGILSFKILKNTGEEKDGYKN
jgi:heme/copper-type cytochrome/quinol oxidase subunit 3